ncbi:hypothetical protein [Dankookia sp. P2]|uniref:hypothetical protein n=1 Tax=Dankookia sp. P2 TaxID=3423955 RepID=UPI003D675817
MSARTGDQVGNIDLQGFATGVVQSARGGQVSLYAVSSVQHGDAVITNAGAASPAEIAASFRLAPTAVGDCPSISAAAPAPGSAGGARTVGFGGTAGDTPGSAAPSPTTFAALGNGRAMASVNAELRAGIAGVDGNAIAHPTTGAALPADLPPSSPHLAWGYFLGDVAAQANGGSDRDHVGLGFWVAGRPVTLDGLRTLTGTATYSGGLIGTAADARSVRTVVGRSAHQWDFARRTGSLNAAFDGASWTGVVTTMPGASASFAGTAGAVPSAGRGDLTLSVQGGFYHNPATGGPLANGNLPQATGGQFGVRSSLGLYGANGIMVGTRR